MNGRFLKTMTILLCALVLLLAAAPAYAVSQAEYDISQLQQPTAALDLVILLDNSGSMYVDNGGNDVESFRYDAASIMLNMCEAQGTKAAVYEFNQKPIPIGSGELESIDMDSSTRSDLVKRLDKRIRETSGQNGSGKTYLGTALLKAVEVLDAGEATRDGRSPVILILADGKCDDDDAANLQNAKELCKQKGYKIYSVLLQGGESYDIQTLSNLALETHGKAFTLDDAANLPMKFAEVFADQTGAELTYNTKEPELIGDDLWEVSFTIPNAAVAECNIMIPTSGLREVQLFQPNQDTPVNESDISDNVYYYTSGVTSSRTNYQKNHQLIAADTDPRFIQYKIMGPMDKQKDLGVWRLRFRADSQDDAKNVSITVVFDYNLTLKSSMEAESNEKTCNKGESFDLFAQFYTPSDQATWDETLYHNKENDQDESGISCRAYYLPEGMSTVIDSSTPYIELQANPADYRFEKLGFSVKDFNLPQNRYIAGDYWILIKAEGDGLIRSANPFVIHIVNQQPVAREHEMISLTVDDPVRGMDVQDEAIIQVGDYLSDPDGDFDVKSVTDGSVDNTAIAASAVNTEDKAHPVATITTAGATGDTTFRITMTDLENTAAEFTVPIHVDSVLNELKNGYAVKVIPNPPANDPEAGRYAKSETVTLKVVYETTDSDSGKFSLDNFEPHIDLYQKKINADGEETSELLQSGLVKNGTYDVVLDGVDSGVYTYYAKLYARDQEIAASADIELNTGNRAPEVITGSSWDHDGEIGCEKIPDTWLGHKNTEPWTILFSEMIEDPNQDGIKFTVNIDPEDQKVADIEELLDDAGELTGVKITPKEEGTVKVLITATDDYSIQDPGILADQVYTVKITDRHAITMKYVYIIAAGLVLLLIILWIIRAVTRPKFRNIALEVFVNGAPQKEYPLTSDIKKKSMSAYVPAGNRFTAGHGSAMVIKPARDGATIQVVKPKILSGAGITLTVNNKNVGKNKKIQLRRNNAELKAVINGESMSWKLKNTAGSRPGDAARNKAASRSSAPGNTSGRSSAPGYYR